MKNVFYLVLDTEHNRKSYPTGIGKLGIDIRPLVDVQVRNKRTGRIATVVNVFGMAEYVVKYECEHAEII